jgi:hypothetical protein
MTETTDKPLAEGGVRALQAERQLNKELRSQIEKLTRQSGKPGRTISALERDVRALTDQVAQHDARNAQLASDNKRLRNQNHRFLSIMENMSLHLTTTYTGGNDL